MLIFAGIVISVAGALILLLDKAGFVGRLPGDIVVSRKNFTFYFPFATSILVSVVLSLLFWFFRK
ncbi:MAG: DUF2905 domain-containing protein [Syntrophorhabdaceae bacterium]|nr:DUF2905 domain-containing protein [Syntrophorhabdaceae bacterium]